MNAPRILVTGATGFLGRHLLPVLRSRYGDEQVVGVSSADYDLLDARQVDRMFAVEEPQWVVHLAAYAGGIGANRRYPADFFHRNSLLTTHVFHAAAQAGVRKLVYPLPGCAYPANAFSPIDEGQMWNGYPQAESAAYSLAKKQGLVAAQAYRQQFGLAAVVIVPGNMYGEHDNFSLSDSHVVPALIRRFFEAQRRELAEVTLWGTGQPVRDFVYAGDVAATIPYFLEHYDSPEPVNVSSGTSTAIVELASLIKHLVGYAGRIVWDTSKPDGQAVKVVDVARAR
ncbi:MAG: NAD-dependent epimerase/dehydratase family protein, partial [Pirellulales bacterium]